MPDAPIPPALTPDEWAGDNFYVDTHEVDVRRDPASGFRDMALLNSWLPDGDPRKITRQDVDDARAAAYMLGGQWETIDPVTLASALERLAAKLAALLPRA